MKKTLVIAAREFEEKRFVAYAAVAFAILPFIIAAIPGIGTKSPADVIAMSSLVFATIFALALGVISGASFIGRDLSDGRMSFYFSRPVSSFSIWFGKLTAGILMIVGTFGFIIVPARLAAGVHWTRMVSASTTWSVLYVPVIAIALFLLAHVISTFARSRSPLIVFDFAAAVICGVVIRLLFLPLMAGQAFFLLRGLGIGLGIATVIAIVAGGAWQLERGRTDRRRSHLGLSQFLWGTIAVALLIAAAFVAWVVSVKPSDLTGQIHATRSTNGPFAVVTGTSKGRSDYRGAFLLDTADGATWRVDQWAEWATRYTRDGRSAAVPRRSDSGAEVFIYTRGKAEPVATGLTMTAGEYFVSADGGRIPTITQPSNLSVYDVASKRSLVSVRLPESTYARNFFVTPDLIRLYLNVKDGIKIMELDVPSRALRETGFIAAPKFAIFYSNPSGSQMVVRQSREDALTLHDAHTGAAIRTLTTGAQFKTARYLRDGRIAVVDGPDSATVLHILAADGTPQHDVPLGAKKATRIVGDDGARLVLNDIDAASGRPMLEAVNITSGVIEHRQPVRDWVNSGVLETRPPIEPLREVFYVGDEGHIVAWNPATGGKRLITGG
jgi:ABC-type transport system involved in multi-copper enzyme maturation permease subunit